MAVSGAGAAIRAAVESWPGVEAGPHRFGGTEFRLGPKREIGHIHGDELVDLPLSRRAHDEVIAAGRAEPHHIQPESSWVTFRLREAGDIQSAIELFRLSYNLAVKQKS
ncbi:MAG: luciferase family protein [Anaerolineales bacterium]